MTTHSKSDRDAAEAYAKDIIGSWRTKDDFLAGIAHEFCDHAVYETAKQIREGLK